MSGVSSGVVFNFEDAFIAYNSELSENFSYLDSHIVLEPDHSLYIYGDIYLEYSGKEEVFDGDIGVVADITVPCEKNWSKDVTGLVITESNIIYTTNFEKLDAPLYLYLTISLITESENYDGIMMVTVSSELKNFYRNFSREISKSDIDTAEKKQEKTVTEDKDTGNYSKMKNLYELLEDGYSITIKKDI